MKTLTMRRSTAILMPSLPESRVSKAIYVDDNQVVHAGQSLLDLDPADAEAKLTQAQAQYDQALAQLNAQQPNLPITQRSNATDALSFGSEVSAAKAALAGAQRDYDGPVAKLQQAEATKLNTQSDLARYKQLLSREEIAPSDYDQYLATARAQETSVQASRALADFVGENCRSTPAQLDGAGGQAGADRAQRASTAFDQIR